MARARTGAARTDRRRGREFAGIALVLAVVGVLAAAGSGLQGTGAPPSGSGAPAPAGTSEEEGDTLTIAFAEPPGSLDPALASDPTSSLLVWNLMDSLVRLDESLQPVPALARRWEVSDDARRVRFFLRGDARWTDGAPVTAEDFVFAWKRVLSPGLRSPHAERLLGIAGAAEYHACVQRCDVLEDRVGVRARGERQLVVRLASPQPWFPAATAHPAFLPVPSDVVEQVGGRWAEPDALVTNGPFSLEELDDDSFALVKNRAFRAAQRVSVGRVLGRVVPDAAARVQAFDAGNVLALDGTGLPAIDAPALVERLEYASYPALGTRVYAFNMRSLLDVHQRRAMALAVDRTLVAQNVGAGALLPATRFTAAGLPVVARRASESAWIPAAGDLDRARAELEQAAVVKPDLTLVHADEAGNRDVALALRDAWRQLGIETTIRAEPPEEYLDLDGPLPPDSVDLYGLDVPYAYPDAVAGLDAWRCDAELNKGNFCHAGFDRLLDEARRERDAGRRTLLARQAEEILFGEEGRVPAVVLFWPAYPNLESLRIAESFTIDPLGLIDLSAVEFD